MRYVALLSIAFTSRGLKEIVSFTAVGDVVPGG